MGYYTSYELEHTAQDSITADAIEEAQKTLWDGEWNPFDEPCKWYEHDADMKKLSEQFPDILFTLFGEGEETGDIWKKYFKNGKVQIARAKITFDPFDPKRLQEINVQTV